MRETSGKTATKGVRIRRLPTLKTMSGNARSGGVELVDGGSILLLDRETADFQSGREFPAVDTELLVQKDDFPDLLEI